MSKVKLPKDIIDAIETAREDYYDFEIIEHICDTSICHDPMMPIARYVRRDEEDYPVEMQKIMDALVNGYEVERTPEEKVLAKAEHFKNLMFKADSESDYEQSNYYQGILDGMDEVLDIFDINLK